MNDPKPQECVDAQAAGPPWTDLVQRIQNGDEDAMKDLYRLFEGGIRFQIYRRMGPQDLDDKVHDIFVIIAESIRNGELREPERLMGYVQTVVRRQLAEYIGETMRSRQKQSTIEAGVALRDWRLDPERRAIEREQQEVAARVLRAVSKRDREVLVRFYFQEQSAGEICRAMELTENQFRLIKSRAKARFSELTRTRLGLAAKP